jgi:hypothetical protein
VPTLTINYIHTAPLVYQKTAKNPIATNKTSQQKIGKKQPKTEQKINITKLKN